jgi:kynureninase
VRQFAWIAAKKVKEYVNEELEDWATLGVEGHLHARHPWLPYHEFLTQSMARLVGANQSEVVVMNSLTVNLHLLMASFTSQIKNDIKFSLKAMHFLPIDMQWLRKLHGMDMIQLMP